MGASNGYKGSIWQDIGKHLRSAADDYLKSLPGYSKPVPVVSSETGASGTATLSFQPRKYLPDTSGRPIRVAHNTNNSDKMYYPGSQRLQNQTLVGNGTPWTLPRDMKDRSEALKTQHPRYPIRTSFFNDEPNKGTILSNYFEYKVVAGKFYEYEILDRNAKNCKKLKAMFKSAIANWPFLHQNQNYLATNYIDCIVSWNTLHDIKDIRRNEWSYDLVQSSKNPVIVRFRYLKSIDPTKLNEHALANPDFEETNIQNVSKCLNIVIFKSLGPEVYKLSSNKFFVKSAQSSLISSNGKAPSQLEVIRGYYYSIKPGMGNIILSFNLSTSALVVL